ARGGWPSGAAPRGGPAVAAAALRPFQVLRHGLDARLDVGLQALRALVLGNGAQHLAQAVEPLARLAGALVGRFGSLVFGAQVGGHDLGTLRAASNWIEIGNRDWRFGNDPGIIPHSPFPIPHSLFPRRSLVHSHADPAH